MNQPQPLSSTDPTYLLLEQRLDEAEVARTRLNRQIRRLRKALDAVRAGDRPEDVDLLLRPLASADRTGGLEAATGPIQPVAGPVFTPAAPPVASAVGVGFPPLPPGSATGYATRFGEGLAPGVAAPQVAPPVAPALDLHSVDVGRLGRMTPQELDQLPFGVVTLDARGRILAYSDTESRLAGLPRDAVVGRNFFQDVAPCTRVREFEGRFKDFAEGRSRLGIESFEFVFHFRHGAQRVVIMFSNGRHRGEFFASFIRR